MLKKDAIMTRIKMKEAMPILVRVPNWIGDAVICLPALEALHRFYPASSITVVAKPRVAPVFRHSPCVNNIIEYDDRGRHKGVLGRLRLTGEIKKERFGLAVLFQNAFDAAFLSFISGIPERIGYARDLRTPLLTRPVPITPEIKKRHQVFYYLHIIEALGAAMPPKPPQPQLRISGTERAWAEDLLKDNGIAGRLLAGVAPGASYGPAKRWSCDGFAATLNSLATTRNAYPIIFGGPDDATECAAVSDRLTVAHLNLAGRHPLGESMALMARMSVFITNDSGPMHLAATLGCPTIAVFGSTDPALTGPIGPNVRVITNAIECSPCFKRECRFGHYKCLTSIGAARVVKEAEELIKKGTGA